MLPERFVLERTAPEKKILPMRFIFEGRLMNAVEVYQTVLESEPRLKYPTFFWNDLYYKQNHTELIQIIRYFIEDVLNWSDEQLYEHLWSGTFQDYQLGVLVKEYYNDDFCKVIDLAYPAKFKPWLFKHFDTKCWSKSLARQAVIWLVNEKLNYTNLSDVYKYLTVEDFVENGMEGMLRKYYKGSATLAMSETYSRDLNPLLFRKHMVLPRKK
ncbi:MAG: hypothetical protein PHP54_06020 [Clostridia bacterium]|nr:hypothetical protein [Clostridia bacterium]